ncbi:MAG: translation initiation factor IF-5A [Nitrososphaerota archaeon]|jgi:translation initiation factor 5A|nr:translation initiation factor IF-5A [Nitrososphaerota archaeon]MDG7036880.1 translation initiation factor IF-5A [Nitrososphaerota archaeon]MDG7037553.1 translation initiation factor IF-5A [Nitrososphaerota archaeon]MDG7039998.1 translation initiation factor IF-5A [Nitrososphaerota archaeon]MDG7043086.1 translation initiation factor IF-5A [Nitrososphaerota archaeon]
MSKPVDLGSVKEGSYVVLDDSPCRVVEVEKSKPGKHGSAKVRLVAIDVFSNVKHSYVGPASSRIEVPMIDKGAGQILSISGNTVQMMDMQTYETIDVDSVEEELRPKIQAGAEVEYWRVMGKIKLVRVKS